MDSHGNAEAAAEAHGFTILGDIVLTPGGRLAFPSPPPGGGLYFIVLRAGGNYVGEGKSYGFEIGPDGKQIHGRFKNYTDPADGIWTELVINAMLKKGGGGRIYLLPMTGGKSERLAAEGRLVHELRKLDVSLWNAGHGRDERTYWSYKMPIFERTYANVVPRYNVRAELTPYASKRLANLHRWVRTFPAKAKALGLGPKDYISVDVDDDVVAEFADGLLHSSVPEEQAQEPIRPVHRARREKPEAEPHRAAPSNTASLQDLVHNYRAEHSDASRDEMTSAVVPPALRSDEKAFSTVRTLYGDFSMTLEALESDGYTLGERETLTIRRSVCRLWKQHGGDVTAKMVEQDLLAGGHKRNAGSIQQITGNVKSTLRALKAAGRL